MFPTWVRPAEPLKSENMSISTLIKLAAANLDNLEGGKKKHLKPAADSERLQFKSDFFFLILADVKRGNESLLFKHL